jgi:hypothetical protein
MGDQRHCRKKQLYLLVSSTGRKLPVLIPGKHIRTCLRRKLDEPQAVT